jgi:hypothetical protein
VHSADDSSHPGTHIAALGPGGPATVGPGGGYPAYAHEQEGDAASVASYGSISRGPYGNGGGQAESYGQAMPPGYEAGRPSQVQRFQEQQLGMRPPTQRQSSYGTARGLVVLVVTTARVTTRWSAQTTLSTPTANCLPHMPAVSLKDPRANGLRLHLASRAD